MENQELLYEGKAKRIYSTNDPEVVRVVYKDSATAFNGGKKAEIDGKGTLNNEISSLLFEKLAKAGTPSHFIERLNGREQLVRRVTIIPLEVVVRNIAAGSLSKRLGYPEGKPLKRTLVEFYYKDDALGDPLLAEGHIAELGLADNEELAVLKEKALQVNTVLSSLFLEAGVTLVDFKLEFGKTVDGEILLADEISPDTCRLWDSVTKEKFDKDVFRRDLGSLIDAYEKIYAKLKENQHV